MFDFMHAFGLVIATILMSKRSTELLLIYLRLLRYHMPAMNINIKLNIRVYKSKTTHWMPKK